MKTKKLLLGGLLKPVMRKMVASAQKAKMKKTPEIAKEEFESIKAARDVVQKQGITLEGKKIDTDFLSEKDAIFKDMGTILTKRKSVSYDLQKDIGPGTLTVGTSVGKSQNKYREGKTKQGMISLSYPIGKSKGGLLKQGKPKLALRGWK